MILTITDWAGDRVSLEPKVELYSVRDFMGKELPGLAIVLDKVGGTPDEAEEYAVLTVSFGDYLRRYDEYMGIGRADRSQDQGMSMQ